MTVRQINSGRRDPLRYTQEKGEASMTSKQHGPDHPVRALLQAAADTPSHNGRSTLPIHNATEARDVLRRYQNGERAEMTRYALERLKDWNWARCHGCGLVLDDQPFGCCPDCREHVGFAEAA